MWRKKLKKRRYGENKVCTTTVGRKEVWGCSGKMWRSGIGGKVKEEEH